MGAFAVAICAYLAATYLTVETEGTPLEDDFRRRAIAAGLVSGVLGIAGLVLAPAAAPPLAQALFGRGLPLTVLALLNGPLALLSVWRSRPRLARIAVITQVVFVLWAWAIGQWPYLVPTDVTIQGSAGFIARANSRRIPSAVCSTAWRPLLSYGTRSPNCSLGPGQDGPTSGLPMPCTWSLPALSDYPS